ncbi:MAG: hypothetical protein KAV87_06180 [Desulfobacteraceae bacterium]|nr:hypothetical protein [Desulfobacteraceae bacterium]
MRNELRIENITPESLENMNDSELRYTRSRCLNIFDRYFAHSDVQKAVEMDRRFFLTRYLLLRSEMESRGMKLFRERPLDKEVHNRIIKASLWKLDVPALGDLVAIPNYVSICGDFIKSPVSVEKVDVIIRSDEEHRNEEFEAKIGDLVKEQTNKEPNFIYDPKGPDKSYIPLFDLVLKSHEETRKMKIAKKNDKPIDVSIKKLSPAQRKECDEETARIKENEKLPIAGEIHEFKPAKYTHPNGHPRCLICGDEESIGKVCNMTKAWYSKHDWDDEEAWAEERKKLKASGKIKKLFAIKKPEESETTIRIPVGPDCEVTATIVIDKGQGISALYCGKIKKIRTYLFDKRVKTWTMATARAWIKEHSEKKEKALGEGRGVGGPRQGVGGAEICVCPKCGYEEEHERGDPCAKIKCPKCGTPMVGKAQKQAIFKIIKIDKAKKLAGGIVYEPNTEDTQGDLASKEEIEKALTSFMKRYATDTKRIKINHKGKRYFFPIIESFIPEQDIVKGGETIPAGAWWLMIHISNDKIWNMVVDKELEGFSMGGHSKAKA